MVFVLNKEVTAVLSWNSLASMLALGSQTCHEDRLLTSSLSQFGGLPRRFHSCIAGPGIQLCLRTKELVHLVLCLEDGHLHILACLDLDLLLSFLDMGFLLNRRSLLAIPRDRLGPLGIVGGGKGIP